MGVCMQHYRSHNITTILDALSAFPRVGLGSGPLSGDLVNLCDALMLIEPVRERAHEPNLRHRCVLVSNYGAYYQTRLEHHRNCTYSHSPPTAILQGSLGYQKEVRCA